MSYGTVMIAKLKTPGTGQLLVDAGKKWEERQVPGFQGSWYLLSDDGESFVLCGSFESKESYLALANDPAQDEWFQSVVAPMIAGEVQWTDGTWSQ